MSHAVGADVNSVGCFQANTSVNKALVDALQKNGSATALIEGQTGKTASFLDILQQSKAIAAGLRSAGVTAGDYVLVCCDKSIVSYSAVFGTMFTGATVVFAPLSRANVIHKRTQGHRIKAVISDSVYLDTVSSSLRQMSPPPSLVITTDKVTTSLAQPAAADHFQVFEPEDVRQHVSMIFFTSGTTGEPKGIQITDVAVHLRGQCFKHAFSRRWLVASPLYWSSAFFPVLSGVWFNFTVILNNSSELKENLALIEKYKIDVWSTNVGSLSNFAYEPALHNFDLSSITRVFAGGECICNSVAENFVKTVLGGRAKLEVIYGTTEVGAISSFKDDLVQTGGCGQLYPGVEVKILDDDGNVVPIVTLGRVWIKSVAMTPGYWGRPDLNKNLIDKDGFYDSGDVGFFDEEFNIFLRGRSVDLINYKGTKVSPCDTEDVLFSHSEVLDAAVVATPHSTDIQHMTAFVELRPGASITTEELVAFVNERVEDEGKLRGGVYFLDNLRRTGIVKVNRNALREYKST